MELMCAPPPAVSEVHMHMCTPQPAVGHDMPVHVACVRQNRSGQLNATKCDPNSTTGGNLGVGPAHHKMCVAFRALEGTPRVRK